MITLAEYLGIWHRSHDWTPERQKNAKKLLFAVEALERVMLADGIVFPNSPVTKSGVSGNTLGGFRPQVCSQGAKRSLHKEGLAVDRYDPLGKIDAWCVANLSKLEASGIWIESPVCTQGWSHWQCVPPKSGRRIFLP